MATKSAVAIMTTTTNSSNGINDSNSNLSDSGNNSSTVTMTTVTALNAAWRVCARGAHEMAQTQLAQEVPDLSVPARGESFG